MRMKRVLDYLYKGKFVMINMQVIINISWYNCPTRVGDCQFNCLVKVSLLGILPGMSTLRIYGIKKDQTYPQLNSTQDP